MVSSSRMGRMPIGFSKSSRQAAKSMPKSQVTYFHLFIYSILLFICLFLFYLPRRFPRACTPPVPARTWCGWRTERFILEWGINSVYRSPAAASRWQGWYRSVQTYWTRKSRSQQCPAHQWRWPSSLLGRWTKKVKSGDVLWQRLTKTEHLRTCLHKGVVAHVHDVPEETPIHVLDDGTGADFARVGVLGLAHPFCSNL